MRRYWWVLGLLAAGFVSSASAGDKWRLFGGGRDACPYPPPCLPGQPLTPAPAPGSPMDPSTPLTPPAGQPASSPFSEALASAGEAGTQPGASYLPGMFGDLIGGCTLTPVAFEVPDSDGPFLRTFDICIPNISQASGIKIAEGDSPRPQDRVFYRYNMYANIRTIDDDDVPLLNVNRHLIGFEKTFLGGNASVGMRLPFFGLTGSPSWNSHFVGDLSIVTKFAIVNNPATGNVLAGGVVITTPTGSAALLLDDNGDRARQARTYPVIVQPYGGYIYNVTPRFYVHGFHAIAVPTLASEPTFMANDLGVGLWLYRNPDDAIIRGIIPTLEIHVNTPFNHRGEPADVGDVQMRDSVNLTTGFYVVFPRSLFGGAVGVPLAYGPHTIEALASYTLRF